MTQHRSPKRHRRSEPQVIGASEVEVEISRIGEQGDGIAETRLGRFYVPLTTTGDRVRVRRLGHRGDGFAAALVAVLSPGPGRAEPPCPHFGACGGCILQHLADEHYAAWKTNRVTAALARVGLADCPIGPLVRTPPGGRRRTTFAVSRQNEKPNVRLGFKRRGSHSVVDLAVCRVLDPLITSLLTPLRGLLDEILPPNGRASVTVTRLDGGLDVLLEGNLVADAQGRERLARFALEADLARLSWRPEGGGPVEPLALRRPPRAVFGGVPVAVVAGGFLQASSAGEAALVAAVQEAIAAASPVADLFSGSGTFALPLARAGAGVHAIDADAAAVEALLAAARTSTIASRLTCERRNLFTRPVAASELARFAAVVIDPPRAGARAQAEALAGSAIPVVVYVSCNPTTFARDARLLIGGGFRLEKVMPVDQFLWSAHVELAAVFRQQASKN